MMVRLRTLSWYTLLLALTILPSHAQGEPMRFRIRWGSIRNKIIIWAFVPAALILLTVAVVYLYAYQNVTERLVIERDRELTRLSAKVLATELAKYADPLSEQFLSVFDSGMVVFDASKKILAVEPEAIEGWGTTIGTGAFRSEVCWTRPSLYTRM